MVCVLACLCVFSPPLPTSILYISFILMKPPLAPIVRVYEAYEVKQRVALVRVPFYFINLLPTSLLYNSPFFFFFFPAGGWLWELRARIAFLRA